MSEASLTGPMDAREEREPDEWKYKACGEIGGTRRIEEARIVGLKSHQECQQWERDGKRNEQSIAKRDRDSSGSTGKE
jgi:hypothetical protein